MRISIIYYTVIFTFLKSIQSARILGLFPHTGKSHHMVFEPLLIRLAERGHNVTVASFFPHKNPPPTYKDISFEGLLQVGVETWNLEYYEGLSVVFRLPVLGRIFKMLREYNILPVLALSSCSKVIAYPPLIDALNKEYDVVLMESFNSDCMFGLLHLFNIEAPVIGLSSCALMPWSADRIGVADNPSYVPAVSTSHTSRMTFLQRMENTFLKIYQRLWYRYNIELEEKALIEKQFGKQIPDLGVLGKNISLILMNTYHPLNGVTPLVPGVVEVGGLHLDPRRKYIPPYIEKFLNESQEGVVLFSFGSLIKTSTMPKYKQDMIMNVLSKLKQRVIWKYEDSGEEGTLIGNILRVRWLPQYELLQHNKIIAFIAHGGLLGMTEAVSAGKPMVVVPFFGDQPANAAAAAAAGFAKVVSYGDLTEDVLAQALESVLSAEMRMNARRVSKIWHDRESSPLDTAVFWTERVIRWGHAAPLHTSARELAFYELALLDVAAAYILIIVFLITITWYTLSKLSRLFIKESKEKVH